MILAELEHSPKSLCYNATQYAAYKPRASIFSFSEPVSRTKARPGDGCGSAAARQV